jgi:hypothetical protein
MSEERGRAATRPARRPSLYQVNTRVWLTALSRDVGRMATLDDVPDAELDRWSERGFDWIWLLSVWRTGEAGRQVSRSRPEWRREFEETLSGLRDEDIIGSGFAITGYTVADSLGGDAALARLRERMRTRGLRMMLDFVPNHTGLDHPWVEDHPEFFVRGTEPQRMRSPGNYTTVRRAGGDVLLAHGRDPYFPSWPDTLQLDYGNLATQEAMISELEGIAGRCDGVRCDMAMLVLPEVFERTWGIRARPFWPEAIRRVRERSREFIFLAEVYWDMEWTLQRQGFDYTYDKRLYDRLRAGDARPVREHLQADVDYQERMARFLENHDEPRAAATFPLQVHRAAAVLTYLSPGLRFFHQGQLEGFRKRISPHLGRGPDEPVNREVSEFYERLLAVLRRPEAREGEWRLLECAEAWAGNGSWDRFVAFAWQGADGGRLLVAVNDGPHPSQCYVRLPFPDLAGRSWRLQDTLGNVAYERDGDELLKNGLYLDEPAYHAAVYVMSAVTPKGVPSQRDALRA